MSSPRPPVDPAMQAWIDEQKTYFQPSDMDAAIRLMRAYRRANARRSEQPKAA